MKNKGNFIASVDKVITHYIQSWNIVVSVVTRLWPAQSGFRILVGEGERDFSLLQNIRLALGPTQSPVQWVLGVLFSGLK
jgi:hypothetical protein